MMSGEELSELQEQAAGQERGGHPEKVSAGKGDVTHFRERHKLGKHSSNLTTRRMAKSAPVIPNGADAFLRTQGGACAFALQTYWPRQAVRARVRGCVCAQMCSALTSPAAPATLAPIRADPGSHRGGLPAQAGLWLVQVCFHHLPPPRQEHQEGIHAAGAAPLTTLPARVRSFPAHPSHP
ncbi:MAG: hypothetical protein ACPIOQ_72845, partial [Promethearchaeia archaeon]